MNDSSCVFCAIVSKTEPASVVHEDGRALAFMDIRPVRPGTCVVIPKAHIDHFTDVDTALAAHLMSVALRLGRRVRERFRPLRVGFVVHGFGVSHAHLIVVPQHHPDDITSQHMAAVNGEHVSFTRFRVPVAPRAELDRLAADLSRPVPNEER
jgi:histidine triad (HIT) family protein